MGPFNPYRHRWDLYAVFIGGSFSPAAVEYPPLFPLGDAVGRRFENQPHSGGIRTESPPGNCLYRVDSDIVSASLDRIGTMASTIPAGRISRETGETDPFKCLMTMRHLLDASGPIYWELHEKSYTERKCLEKDVP